MLFSYEFSVKEDPFAPPKREITHVKHIILEFGYE
jgi:hypothetical protein